MKPFYYTSVAIAALTVAFAGSAQAASSWNQQEVVRSTSGLVVTDSRGNCVRTDSIGNENECNIMQFTEAEKPAPRTVLSSAERTIYFEFDSTVLTPEGKGKLDSLSNKLRNARDIRSADIVGFADRMGTSKYNVNLSAKRAKVVQDYMSQRGYLNTRVADVRAVGESQSTTPCQASREQMIQCLGPDRKVEVEVVYADQKQPVAQNNVDQYNERN